MAEKGKKSAGAGDKPAATKSAKVEDHEAASHDHEMETAKPLVTRSAHDEGAAVHAAHAAHAPDRREYFMVFGALFALTVLEVVLANPKLGISRTLVGIGLVGMAVTKAAMVGFFYMHLKHETKFLKYTVAIPMATPAFYALVLVTEAAWRLTRF